MGFFDDVLQTSPAAAPPSAPPGGGGFFADIMSSPVQHGSVTIKLPNGQTSMDASASPEADPPSVGVPTALARGALAGATANFGDEIAGLSAASGTGSMPNVTGLPVDQIVGLARLGYETLTGQPGEATKRYTGARDAARKDLADAVAAHPNATLLGEIGGAIATPGGALLRGATLPARMLSGAVAGAAYGGVSGAGAGTTASDRLTQGASGAALGAVGGAAAPPLAAGLATIGGAVARPLINAVRGLSDPEGEAARRVATAISRDATVGRPGLSNADFTGAQQAGLPVANIDLGGETTRALARSAANTSPEGRAALQRLADDRFEGQSDRASRFLSNIIGGAPDTEATREAIKASAMRANRPAYARAYQEGSNGLWSPELERLTSSPDIVSAMSDAATKGKSRAVAEGFGGFNPGVTFDNGILNFRRGPNGVPSYPDLQFWDYTKRALDDKAGAARRAGRNSEAAVLTNLSQQLRGELDRLVPSYSTARAGAAAHFGAENALDAGAHYVRSNMTAAEGARGLARMSPVEKAMFRRGFVAQLINDINNTRDRANVLLKIGQSPQAREKLETALGPRGYRMMDAYLTVEHAMDALRGSLGNSTTARQLVELGLAGGAGYELSGGDLLHGGAGATAGVLAAFLTRRAGARIDQRVAQRVAEMLVSSDPNVLARGVHMVASHHQLLEALRAIGDRSAPRIAGQQGSNIAPLQAAGVSRADDSQPKVPRPPGQ